MPTDGERLATLEQVVKDLRGDVQELSKQQDRTRGRLHDLESTARGQVELTRMRAREQQDQQQRLTRWIQILTLIIAAAGVIGPLVYSGATH